MRPRLEAVDRRVAGGAPGALPVLDDAELAGMLEERVEPAHDHHVEVDEERRPGQVEERLAERGDLPPAALGATRIVEIRQRAGVDPGREARGVVGHADEAVRPLQVAAHHGRKPVHVLGAVLRAPFHADHVRHRPPNVARQPPARPNGRPPRPTLSTPRSGPDGRRAPHTAPPGAPSQGTPR